VLKIQSNYINKELKATLLIDKNDLSIDYLYDNFEKVIFYDSSDTYPVRISKSLSQIDSDYVLLLHDIDILLKYDLGVLEFLQTFLINNQYDRIDLKYTPKINGELIYEIIRNGENNVIIEKTDLVEDGEYYLISQNDETNYIYNVNPSIWKKNVIIDIMEKFPHKNYRTIEDPDVQVYCKKFNIFKIYSKNQLLCGYFECVDFFVFLHISHSGKLLPLNNSFTTVYGQSYNDVKDDYIKIVNEHNLKQSTKWIHL
jgi:hypothetical protein